MANAASSEALLTEHFRFTPLSLIDEIINTVNAIIYRALQAIESGLLNTPPATLGFSSHSSSDQKIDVAELARAEIENGVHQLETLLEATVDKDFDKFEIYVLRNILKVPDGLERFMRLSHYENIQLPLPSSAATPTSILSQRQALQESQKLQMILEAEYTSNASLLSQLRAILSPIKTSPSTSSSVPSTSPLATLAQAVPSSHTLPLTTNAQFTTSQLPAVRTILEVLRPKLQGLANRGVKAGEENERREYVDNVTKRVVRDNIGVGDGGEMDLGKNVTNEEVLAMEGVVGEKS